MGSDNFLQRRGTNESLERGYQASARVRILERIILEHFKMSEQRLGKMVEHYKRVLEQEKKARQKEEDVARKKRRIVQLQQEMDKLKAEPQ